MATKKKTDDIVFTNISNTSAVCRMCGTGYGKMNGYFYKSYSQLYKGVGYMPVCKRCVDYLYESYLSKCGSSRDACRQVCRKLDLYWDDTVFNAIQKDNTARSSLVAYITRINQSRYANLSYDDTLEKAGLLWDFVDAREAELERLKEEREKKLNEEMEDLEVEIEELDNAEPVSDEIKEIWGAGYTDNMYRALEERRQYWVVQLSKDGVDLSQTGTQALLRQIVATELDINKDRASGVDVDKKINTLNSLLGSALLKPSQQKIDSESDTPLGVWTWKYEHEKPLPDIDEKLKDKNGIRKYITIWLKGHLAKMVGLKNSYSQMYEDEIKRLTVDKIEYDDDTDDSFLADLFSYDGGDDP